MPEHNHAHGGNSQFPPAGFFGQDGVQEGRIGGIDNHPVPAVGPQLQRFVSLEHEDGFGLVPGSEHRCHLTPAKLKTSLESVNIELAVPVGLMCQSEKQFAVHLSEAPQLETPEQIVGVVDGAIVGADDGTGSNRVVVAVDSLVSASPPACMAKQERGAVVDAG